VLVTGASFGIGRALALQLGSAGARLVLAARSLDRLETLAEQISAAGGSARALVLDLADPSSIETFTDRLSADGVTVDVVVHNAGKSIRRLVTRSLDRDDHQRTMAVDYLGPVQLQLALLPAMLARRGGHVIGVSSLGVRLPPAPRWAAYTAAKTAFDVWLRSARPELRAFGIDTTSVYLGLVHTRMSAPTEGYRTMPGMTPEEAAQVLCRAIVRRPRKVEPWWIRPLRILAPWLEGLVDWVLTRHLGRAPDAPGRSEEGPG
jgi:short-subunit dehydrogenase